MFDTTCTLDPYTDYLVSSTGPTTATGLSRLPKGALSHDPVTRWLSRAQWGSADLWRAAKPRIRRAEAPRPAADFAVLVVDDALDYFVFAPESSRTAALSAPARAAGQFEAVQALAFPDKHPLRVFAGR